jgi:hypothetical protein
MRDRFPSFKKRPTLASGSTAQRTKFDIAPNIASIIQSVHSPQAIGKFTRFELKLFPTAATVGAYTVGLFWTCGASSIVQLHSAHHPRNKKALCN